MIRKPNFIHIDKNGKELQDNPLHLLNLTANDGDIHQFAAGHIPSHWHKQLEIFILLEGSVHIGIGGSIYTLEAGDGCFINSETIHSFTAGVPAPCRFQSFVFSPDIVGGMPGSIFDASYVRPLLENGVPFLKFQKGNDDDVVYFEQFRHAFTACTSELYGYEFQVRNALSSILLYVKLKGTDVPSRPIPSIQETRLKKMLSWIDGHFENTVTVADIASAANICTRECQRIFNQYLHYSPIEYIRQKRIYHAARLLSGTDLPITEIAFVCGFSNPSYFSKQFRSLMDTTPSEYRATAMES